MKFELAAQSSKLVKVVLLIGMLSSSVLASEVSVKYYGKVDLSEFNCTATQSSFVYEICYQPDSGTAIVMLKSTRYAYCGVSQQIISNWLDSESKGRYFNGFIKGRYRC